MARMSWERHKALQDEFDGLILRLEKVTEDEERQTIFAKLRQVIYESNNLIRESELESLTVDF